MTGESKLSEGGVRESNRARVRRLLIEPLAMRHPRGREDAGREMLDAIADELAYIPDEKLEVLARMLAPQGQGAARNFYPDRATFLGFAHLVAPRPLTDDPKLLGWFASVEGPKMIAEGTLVETWSFFERNRRPPFDDRSRRLVAEQAAEHKRRVLLVDERIERGVEVDPEDRAFMLRYRAREAELTELVARERSKRGRV